jgi:hypothetical protein
MKIHVARLHSKQLRDKSSAGLVSHESGHQSIEAQGLWLHRSGRRSQSSRSIGLAPGHKGPL